MLVFTKFSSVLLIMSSCEEIKCSNCNKLYILSIATQIEFPFSCEFIRLKIYTYMNSLSSAFFIFFFFYFLLGSKELIERIIKRFLVSSSERFLAQSEVFGSSQMLSMWLMEQVTFKYIFCGPKGMKMRKYEISLLYGNSSTVILKILWPFILWNYCHDCQHNTVTVLLLFIELNPL